MTSVYLVMGLTLLIILALPAHRTNRTVGNIQRNYTQRGFSA